MARPNQVLVVGGGGREHALGWAIKRSAERSGRAVELLFAPGNGGTAAIGRNVDVAATDIPAIVALAREEGIDLTVVGPEAPLALGIADAFAAAGLRIVGPTKAAARLEWSKAFAKETMRRYGVPTAEFRLVQDAEAARRAAADFGLPVVLKADGLAQGKGVIVAHSEAEVEAAIQQLIVERRFGAAAETVVVERFIPGREVTVMAFVAGGRFQLLPPVRDYKRAYDGDAGPNTGGMGAILPPPDVDEALLERAARDVFAPIVEGLTDMGLRYNGILYAGLMVSAEGPKVLEFNVRFGDPETQALVVGAPLPWLTLFEAMAEGALPAETSGASPALCVGPAAERAAVAVVVAREGYPLRSRSPVPLPTLRDDHLQALARAHPDVFDDVVCFHAGTRREKEALIATGGRIFTLVAAGEGLEAAREKAYAALEHVVPSGGGLFYRTDIGLIDWPDPRS